MHINTRGIQHWRPSSYTEQSCTSLIEKIRSIRFILMKSLSFIYRLPPKDKYFQRNGNYADSTRYFRINSCILCWGIIVFPTHQAACRWSIWQGVILYLYPASTASPRTLPTRLRPGSKYLRLQLHDPK